MIVCTFRGSSAVEQRAVNALVVGSIPTHGASKLDTNSFFENEGVRSTSRAKGAAGLASAAASPPLWREMKRILMLSGE